MRLNIMSYPILISITDFERFKKKIYENVYEVNKNEYLKMKNRT